MTSKVVVVHIVMTSKLSRLLLWATFLMLTTFADVDGFAPGDVSSIAAAVAAAHIGKPPPFHTSSVRDKTATKSATYCSCSISNVNRKYDIIGKAPNRIVQNNQKTFGASIIEKSSSPVTITNVLVGENQHAFERLLCVKRNELDNFILGNNANGKDASNIDQAITNELDNDGMEGVQTVHAVFCGYRATVEELSRLRSAHAI
jgi:hypothetical protein